MPLIETGLAAKRLVESVVSDLYELAKSQAGTRIKRWKAASHLNTISERIRGIRLVKTIWQIEKEVDLTKFFCPPKIYLGQGPFTTKTDQLADPKLRQRRVPINQLADLGYEGNCLLEGTVGQGKSILLRYLASVDFCLNRRIPIFIELRRMKSDTTLLSLALQELKALGFEMDEELFSVFAKNGRIALFLDAFDEVKEEFRADLLADLQNLIREHDRLTVIMTSRPGSGAASSPFLRVFRLSELQEKEYKDVIHKMAHDEATAQAIITGIDKDTKNIAELLTTPLMVALLMVRYKIDQSLPQNSAAFYDSLFSLLLQRHDKSKGGYVRPRKSGVSDLVLQEFFNALCFVTRKAGEGSFSWNQFVTHARNAVRHLEEKGDVEKMIDDIVEITCLVIRDGEEYRFIHRSVQEYHAALFIKGQPDIAAEKFYRGVPVIWEWWDQELRFLENIDRYRYTKHFLLPALETLAAAISDGELSTSDAIAVFGDDYLGFHMGESDTAASLFMVSGARNRPLAKVGGRMAYIKCLITVRRDELPERIFVNPSELPEDLRPSPDASIWKQPGEENGEQKAVLVKDILSLDSTGERFRVGCEKNLKPLVEELKKARKYIAHVESNTHVFDF